jgi:HSP20 family protein
MSKLAIRRATSAVPATNDMWQSLRQQMDDLFDRFSDGFETFSLQPFAHLDTLWSKTKGFAPLAVDVNETDKAYTVTAELPGVAEKDIEVNVKDGVLIIKGEKQEQKEEKSKNRYLSERSYGSFQRMFGLPKGTDESKVDASFQNGVLTVSIPKTAEAPTRKIEVKAA